jgi:hypothetical protein
VEWQLAVRVHSGHGEDARTDKWLRLNSLSNKDLRGHGKQMLCIVAASVSASGDFMQF